MISRGHGVDGLELLDHVDGVGQVVGVLRFRHGGRQVLLLVPLHSHAPKRDIA
jgi:hypothetical protein